MRPAIAWAGRSAAFCIALLIGPWAQAADSYKVDNAHSDVVFAIDHLGLSKTWGRFNEIDGTIVVDAAEPENSIVFVVLQAASVDTGHAKRDEQLRGPDFLDSAAYPAIVFRSQSVEPLGERTARVYGTLTLHGQTRPVTLFTTLNRIAEHPLRPGVMVAGFSGRATIKRSDYGITVGLPVLGDEVEIVLEVEALRQ